VVQIPVGHDPQSLAFVLRDMTIQTWR